jgi:hypothetical protein
MLNAVGLQGPGVRRWLDEDGPAVVRHTHRLLEPEDQEFGGWDDPAALPDTLIAQAVEDAEETAAAIED